MGQQTESKYLQQEVTEQEFKDLLFTLNRLFEGDFSNTTGKAYLKAQATFENMKRRRWTVGEFRETILQLEKRWNRITWMPSDILAIHSNMYGEDRLDDFDEKGEYKWKSKNKGESE